MDPFNAIGNFALGYIKSGRMQKWVRFGASTLVSAFVTFWGTWGLAIPSLYPVVGAVGALILGFGAACVAMSVIVLYLWRRHPLTKELMVMTLGDVETALRQHMEKKTVVKTGDK